MSAIPLSMAVSTKPPPPTPLLPPLPAMRVLLGLFTTADDFVLHLHNPRRVDDDLLATLSASPGPRRARSSYRLAIRCDAAYAEKSHHLSAMGLFVPFVEKDAARKIEFDDRLITGSATAI
jgi:hypothetical protein